MADRLKSALRKDLKMEIKLTRKDVAETYGTKTRSVGYCELQKTLTVLEARGVVTKLGYNSGLYGWNWTAYLIQGTDKREDVILVTGYRNLEGKRIKREASSYLERQADELKTAAILDVLIKAVEK